MPFDKQKPIQQKPDLLAKQFACQKIPRAISPAIFPAEKLRCRAPFTSRQ
jgi:hypothetical protein